MLGDDLEVAVETHGSSQHVSIAGQVDLLTAERFRTALAESVRSSRGTVELDLRDVDYIGSQGAWLLDDAANKAAEVGVDFRIVRASRVVRRVLETLGLSHRLF